MMGLLTTVILTSLMCGTGQALTASKTVDLFNFLFNSDFYNKQVRPVAFYNESLPVLIQYDLFDILEIDNEVQSMTTLGRLHAYWVDNLLAWNTSSQGGIPEILVKQGNIWIPDIVLTNGVGEPVRPGHSELPLYLQQCGSIYWNPVVKLTSHCDVNTKYFPFDFQACHIEFGTEMSMAFEVEFYIHSTINAFWEPLSLYNFRSNSDWELVDTAADSLKNNDVKEDKVRFSFLLQRKNSFSILTLVWPLVILSLASCLVFLLPTEGGEKLTTGLTLLLAYVIYLGLFSSMLPDTALRVSILTAYLLCLLTVLVLVVVTSGLSIRVHHRPVWLPVTPRLASFTRKINGQSRKLDKVMSVSSFNDVGVPIPTPDYPSFSHFPSKLANRTMFQYGGSSDSGFMVGGASFASSVNAKDSYTRDSTEVEVLNDPLKDNIGESGEKPEKRKTNDKQRKLKMPPVTWPEVSKAIDRVCLVVFVVLILLLTVIFILVLSAGGASDKPELSSDTVTPDIDFSPYYNELCCGYDCIVTNTTASRKK